MSLLDANADTLRSTALNTFQGPTPPEQPGVMHNFASSAGNYFMRGMAEVGRGLSMAAGAVPVLLDKVVGDDNFSGESLSDRYFRWHDDVFNRAVDHWTPKPEEVGAAGQVVGSLASGLLQFGASPSLMVATNMLGTSEDLVRQSVSADAALVAGDVAGLASVAGIALPIFGRTLTQRIVTGAAGNAATNIPEAAIKRAIVRADGAPDQVAQQFDPWDARARIVDTLLGIAFGVKAHIDARPALGQAQTDAVMTANASRHLDDAASPWRAADPMAHTQAVDTLRTAVDQMASGRPVRVPDVVAPDGATVKPGADAYAADMRQLIDEAYPTARPIEAPEMAVRQVEPAAPEGGQAKPGAQAEPGPPRFADDLRLPAGDFDPATGEPRTVSANDYVVRAHEEAATVKSTARAFMEAAAGCLLGSI